MSRLFVLVAVVGILGFIANALPINLNQIPEQFQEFVPEEVTKFYSKLTEKDKAILKELAAKHASYANEDEALAALKEKSPELHAKAEELRSLVKSKIDALQQEARDYVKASIEKFRALRPQANERPNLTKIRDTANEILQQYKTLSDAAKDDLKNNFPKIANIIQNDKFQKLAQGLLKPDAAN